MIAVDTSVWINYSNNIDSTGVTILEKALLNGIVLMSPFVLVELLSAPTLGNESAAFFKMIPRLDILPGFFERTAALRKALLKRSQKAKLGDSLIAQNCIDHDIPLATDDKDFIFFASSGLILT